MEDEIVHGVKIRFVLMVSLIWQDGKTVSSFGHYFQPPEQPHIPSEYFP